MVKRCIGIDIGHYYLRAVQVLRTAGRFCIEKVFSTQTRRTTDSPPDILRALFSQYGFDRHADVAISMPHDAVFFRNLETDFAGLEKIREQSSSVFEDNLPIQSDEIVAQVCSYRLLPDEKYSVLTAAATRGSLHERLNILAETKMRPCLAEAPIFAIHSTVAFNHPEIITGPVLIAYVDESYIVLAVIQNNDILIVRNIPTISCPDSDIDSFQEQAAEILSREAQISWRKALGTEIEQNTKIYLVTAGFASNYLEELIEENLHCQTTVVDAYAKVKSPPECKVDYQICIAEGLALAVLAPEKTKRTNFLEADGADTQPALNLKKELGICTALVCAIAVSSLFGLFMRLSHLETNYARIKNEIRGIFQNTLPQEKIVSPLAQLEQKLESFHKDYQLYASFCPAGLAPLEVLSSLSANTPSQAKLKVDDLLIAPDTVRVSGTCDSFDAVYQWQRLLQKIPGFTLVDVQDAQKEPKSGVVHFTILLSAAKSPSMTKGLWGSSTIQEQR